MTYEDFDSVRKIRLPSEVRESAIDQDMNSIFDGLDDGTDSWDDAYGWGDAEDWDGYEELCQTRMGIIRFIPKEERNLPSLL